MKPGEEDRIEALLAILERIAGGEFDLTIPVSAERDRIDAIAYGINIIVGELRLTNDISAKAKEDAEAASIAKSSFLRNISHEIRTPIAAIISLAELLQVPAIGNDERGDLVARVLSNGRALLGLINDVLDLSKVEAGKLEVHLSQVAPREILFDVVKSLAPQAQQKKIGLGLSINPAVASTVFTDGGRLRQILMNVVGNAIKFTERGQVRVSAGPGDASFALVIEVQDSGIGISAGERQELFEPFAQGGEKRGRLGGTGLGLALSRRLAQQLAGDLELLESAPRLGSTFRLCIGRLAGEPVAPTPPAKPSGQELQGLRVLLAEDNEDIHFALASLLELMGASVEVVEDGEQAILAAQQRCFDVILMDVQMPVKNGLEATRALRAQGLRTPIIALTADAMQEHRQTCIAAGCDAHLSKPIEIEDLAACLASYHGK